MSNYLNIPSLSPTKFEQCLDALIKAGHPAMLWGPPGCVDQHTEFLTPQGWKAIGQYKPDDLVAQYNLDGSIEFVKPTNFIKFPASHLYHLTSMFVDQMLCGEHRFVYWEKEFFQDRGDIKPRLVGPKEKPFADLVAKFELNGNQLPSWMFIKGAFNYSGLGLDVPLVELGLQLAATLFEYVELNKEARTITFRSRLDKKVGVLIDYCLDNGLKYEDDTDLTRKKLSYGLVVYYQPSLLIKEDNPHEFPVEVWQANREQLAHICKEVERYRPNNADTRTRCGYHTLNKNNADFVQFAFASCGIRSIITTGENKYKSGTVPYYDVRPSLGVDSTYKAYCSAQYMDIKIKQVPTKDGFKYCFEVPSSYLVLRRNDKIFVTGNCGKSQVIKNYAKKNGFGLTIRMLAQMLPSDFMIPYVDQASGVAKGALANFLASIPHDQPHILFLDELNAAPPDVQVACYQLILDRQIGEFKLPDTCYIVAAGNRPEDGALASAMNTAIADRLIHFSIQPDAAEWVEWAIKADIHPYVTTFIKVKPEYLAQSMAQQVSNTETLVVPTPRSWERVSDVLKTNPSPTALEYILSGIVGLGTTAVFKSTLEQLQNLAPVEEYFKPDLTLAQVQKMMPGTITGLYGLAYSMASYITTPEQIVQALAVFKIFKDAKKTTKLPVNEVFVTAAMLFLQKARDNNLMVQVVINKNFSSHIQPVLRENPSLADLAKAA